MINARRTLIAASAVLLGVACSTSGSSGGSAGAGGRAGAGGGGVGGQTTGSSGTTGGAGRAAGGSRAVDGGADASKTPALDGGADAIDSGCEVASITTLPDFTKGQWLIFNSVNTMAAPYVTCSGGSKCIWDGSVLSFTSETPSCGGAKLQGTFHWVTTDGVGNGRTTFTGRYDAATGQLLLSEYQVVENVSGVIVTGVDMVTYSAASDTLTNGTWTCTAPCSPGTWSARRVTQQDAGADGAGTGDGGCDAATAATLDFTKGFWQYYNSVDTHNVIWDGTTVTFTSTGCDGSPLTATAHWASTDGQYSTTEFYNVSYNPATRQLSWNGYALADEHGGVVLDDDTATYDPATDQLVSGSWTMGWPGTFAARHVTDAGSTGPSH